MTPGLFSFARIDYDRLTDCVNWSRLKLMGKSPAHYREEIVNPSPDTDARQRGRAVHVAVFEPERFASQYQAWDGRRAGKEWEKFRDACEARGGEAITEGMRDDALAIAGAVRANPLARQYLEGGKAEATVLWQHVVPDMGGLKGYAMDCKGRIDFLSAVGAVVDLKTCRDSSRAGFARQVLTYGYHAQAAFYVDGLKAARVMTAPRYVIVAVEPLPPYATTVFRVPESIIQLGREHYRSLMDRLHYCREHNSWPAYEVEEVELQLPSWDGEPIAEDDPAGLGLSIGG